MKKNNTKSTGAQFGELMAKVQKFLDRNFDESFSQDQLFKIMRGREKKQYSALTTVLDKLVKNEKIQVLPNKNYQSLFTPQTLIGVIDHVNPRFAYLVSPDLEEDPIIYAQDMHNALDGDTVKVMLVPSKNSRNNGRVEGEVLEIIERKKTEFVGKIQLNKNFAFLIPDSKKIFTDFYIPEGKIMDAKNGDKVIVKFTHWYDNDKSPHAEVIKILGKSGENEVEMHAIMAEFGLPVEFPNTVTDESENISGIIDNDEIKKRRDFRHILTFTIDPADAKDFDDAISIQTLPNGNTEVGVHIADVTHYVVPGTELEREAAKRATSVYLVDRCVPMLPEKLSNDLCSLKPNVDRYTFSAVFEMTDQAQIVSEWYGKTIIHSDRRYSYEEAQEILEGAESEHSTVLLHINALAKMLRKERFRNGAVNFETVEVKFKLNEKGEPLGVFPKVRKDAHKLIEEFMLLANKKVAEYVFKHKNGKEKNIMVYRIHDEPDPEKMRTFANFALRFGYKLNADSKQVSKELNTMMEAIEGKPEQNVLENLAVRAMAKAKYTINPLSHFGLAFEHYTHFTSPIRRYPDMMVHRLLQMYLTDTVKAELKDYEQRCKQSSEMEKLAADAERASIKYKQAEYMTKMLGMQFQGIITGVTEWGIFVEIIETKCEGLVRFSDMKDDFYDLDIANYRAIGRKYHVILNLGDKVLVNVKNTDMEKRTIDLLFIEKVQNA
ncbi:MAG: ribonuclease R [Cytophagales bacterium]|nr:ribonuclease R [Cytophagales bacterium]